MTEWLEISVPVAAASLEDVAAMISDQIPAAKSGVEIRATELVFWVPVELGEAVLAETRELSQNLAAAGMAVRCDEVAMRPAVPEAEWRDAWKRYFKTTRVTRQLVIVPSWDRHTIQPGDLLLHLDPGQAFGTGDHATTRLVLTILQELADGGANPDSIIDVGCGSGILTIAAALLWPTMHGVAVDVDPIAVGAARDNFARNQVAEKLHASDTPVSELSGSFPLAVANIRADVLVELAPAIAARVASGGTLILSGILTNQTETVVNAYTALGFSSHRVIEDDHGSDWIALQLEKPQ